MLDFIITLAAFCINDALGPKLICEIDTTPPAVVKYDKLNVEDACYKDGIYYPRCKDLENPEVWHYHKLLNNR